ncbi:MAG: BLUF domain-containing protein [Arcicella sp.]|nr:BLUF domain-containing protein [Arcicella sp.]
MYELLYSSIAKPDLAGEDILDILKTSQEFNLKYNITGCLLYFDKEFIQILEGDEQSVKNLFSKIKKDIRHTNVNLLLENGKTERVFKNWSMAFNGLSIEDMNNIDRVLLVNNFITFSELDYKSTKASKLFFSMAKEPFKKLLKI